MSHHVPDVVQPALVRRIAVAKTAGEGSYLLSQILYLRSEFQGGPQHLLASGTALRAWAAEACTIMP